MTCTPMTSVVKRLSIALIGAIAVVSIAAGCSSSSDSSEVKYCKSWQKVADSFEKLNDIAITTDGIKGLDTAVNDISGSIKQLVSSADAMLKPKVEALQSALNDFGDALSSPEMSADYLNTLKSKGDAVDSAWNDLVATAKTSCPDVKASAV